MAGIEDLIETYRGETINLNPFRKRWSSLLNAFGKARVGKYSTTAAAEAIKYASNKFPNKVLKALITPLEMKIGQKMFHELEPDYTDQGVKTKRIRKKISNFIRDKGGRNYNLLSTKNKNKLKIDILKTIASNAKALTPLALKGLSVAASLPAQVVYMTLVPTEVNADEVNMKLEDFAKLAEAETNKAQGGRIGFDEGGSTQKEIDKALVAIEKLKPGLMPESYEALIEVYKDKQKELDIGIMESAGGLGEMLGEGGRIGFANGTTSDLLYINPMMNPDNKNILGGAGILPVAGIGGILALSQKDKDKKKQTPQKTEGPKLPDPKPPFKLFDLIVDFINANSRRPNPREELQLKEKLRVAAEKAQQYADEMDAEMWDAGRDAVDSLTGEKELKKRLQIDQKDAIKEFEKRRKAAKKLHAEGGRIGFQEGEGVMSQTGIPYYADKAVEGIVNSAETLSKLPFAAGELGSKLLRQKPTKKMFSEALENITPGSWSKNLGLQSLIEKEGAKVSGKQRVIGDVLGLGTEIAAPVGGAFKIGQKLISQASKVMGKLKKGKTLEQAIDDKITSFGQSRRDFNIVAGTSGLMVALKAIGLGGIVTKADDFAVKLKTKFFNDDVDYGATGQAFFDLSSLTGPVKLAASSLIKKLKIKDLKNVDPGDAKLVIKNLKDKGFNGKLTGIVDEGGDVIKQAEKAGHTTFLKTYKKQSMKQNVKDHKQYNDFVIYENDPGWINWKPKAPNFTPFKSTIDEVVEILEPVVKKAAGGPVGFPPEVYGPPAPKKIPSPIPLPPTDGPSPRPNIQKFRDPYWEFDIRLPAKEKPGETVDPREGIGLDAFGDIDVDMSDPRFQFGRYDPKKGYHPWEFEVGKDSAGVKWKKRFDQGGIARRPNAVPPLSGPTPQGLTFLLGDDIVKSRIK